jgi:hypothetical protein
MELSLCLDCGCLLRYVEYTIDRRPLLDESWTLAPAVEAKAEFERHTTNSAGFLKPTVCHKSYSKSSWLFEAP